MTAKKAKKSRNSAAKTMIGKADFAEVGANAAGDPAEIIERDAGAENVREGAGKRSEKSPKRSEKIAKRSDLFDNEPAENGEDSAPAENRAENTEDFPGATETTSEGKDGGAETFTAENAKTVESVAQSGGENLAKNPEAADDFAQNSEKDADTAEDLAKNLAKKSEIVDDFAKKPEDADDSASKSAKNSKAKSLEEKAAASENMTQKTAFSARAGLFDRATVKLTLIYTAIIFAISLSFSCAIGVAAMGAANSPLDHPPIEVRFRDGTRASFDNIFRSRRSEVNDNIVTDLVILNAGILFLGAGLSFVLARKTLDPIETAMDEQADFVANASHELKTPLAVMQTENEVALRDESASAPELRENLADNLREVKKLRQLTDYLLAMNAADRADVELAESDLIEVIPAAVGRVSARAAQKNVRISRKIAPEKVVTDAESLGEIVYILLDNAIKYAPRGTEVELVANAREISVRDHGGGVAEEDLPRLFERFYRGEKSHTSEGFGLGLALAKTLAGRIGARITAENVHEKGEIAGAKFTIKF